MILLCCIVFLCVFVFCVVVFFVNFCFSDVCDGVYYSIVVGFVVNYVVVVLILKGIVVCFF